MNAKYLISASLIATTFFYGCEDETTNEIPSPPSTGTTTTTNEEGLTPTLSVTVAPGNTGTEIAPTAADVEGFNKYIEAYKAGLAIEKAAVEAKK